MSEVKCDFSYDLLWKLLIDRRMKKKDLRQKASLSPNVIAKMGRRESVSLETLAKICMVLGCDLSDIVKIIPKEV